MPEYRVTVESKVSEVYYIDAENEEEARENWYYGNFSHTSDTWDSEVADVEEVEE